MTSYHSVKVLTSRDMVIISNNLFVWELFYFHLSVTRIWSRGPINDTPELVPIMAGRRTGDNPWFEAIMISVTDAYLRRVARRVNVDL